MFPHRRSHLGALTPTLKMPLQGLPSQGTWPLPEFPWITRPPGAALQALETELLRAPAFLLFHVQLTL